MRLASIILILAALAGTAAADDEAQNRARAHYEIGLGMYRLGDFRGALREFAAGYELTHKPGFLVNLGQTYRKLHELGRARDLYRQFLSQTPPNDPQRAQAEQVLADIEKELREQPPEVAPPPPVAPPPTVLAPPPTPTARVTVVERPPRKRGLTIGGIVLAVAGLGLVGGGAGSTVVANDLADDLNALDRNRGNFDPSKEDRYQLDRALGGALFGIGGALAATGVILIVLGAR